MGFVDLHTHSTASDGTLSPARLVEYGKEKGLDALALTDHDTVAGLSQALDAGVQTGLKVIPGIEMSTHVDGCSVHIVGLFIDPGHPALARQLVQMAESRRQRNRDILARLEEAGLDIHPGDLDDLGGRAVTRGHIAHLLVRGGYAVDSRDAIDRYLAKGTPGYVARKTPPPEVCIDTIHRAGGLAFVAHINRIHRHDPGRSLAVCRRVLEAGADGLETLYCQYDTFWEEAAEALAREYGVLRSGGSDYHGSIKEGLDLGVGYGGLRVPSAFLDAIQAARGL